MTTQLPYCDIFPHLHPMQDFIPSDYPILADILEEYLWDLNYYREQYLDADRIDNALKWIKQHGDLDHKTIKYIINKFSVLDFSSHKPELTTNNTNQWIIWLFIVGAFVLINQAIDSSDVTTVKNDIRICLKNAHDYKRLWKERACRYKGANKTNAKKAKIKNTILEITRKTDNANLAKADGEKISIIKKEFKRVFPGKTFPYKDSSFTRNDHANMFTQAAKLKPTKV